MRSQMQSSPCSAPEASRFGVSSLNSSPQTCQTITTQSTSGKLVRDSAQLAPCHSPARCASRASQPRHPPLSPRSCNSKQFDQERSRSRGEDGRGGGGSILDHAQRIPHGDGAVAEATGEEAEGEGVAVSGAGAGPGEAVEAVGGRGGGEEGEVGRVGLEVEAEDLDVGRRGEEHVDGAAHGAGGEVGRLRRQRRQRRPLRALDARHLRRRDPADLGTRAPSPLAATRNLFLGDLETGEREREGRKEIEGAVVVVVVVVRRAWVKRRSARVVLVLALGPVWSGLAGADLIGGGRGGGGGGRTWLRHSIDLGRWFAIARVVWTLFWSGAKDLAASFDRSRPLIC